MPVIHPVIINCLMVCGVLLVGVIFDEYVLKWIRNGIIGVACIYICDLFLPAIWQVGISGLTVLVTVLLGVPGILMLYLISIYLS